MSITRKEKRNQSLYWNKQAKIKKIEIPLEDYQTVHVSTGSSHKHYNSYFAVYRPETKTLELIRPTNLD